MIEISIFSKNNKLREGIKNPTLGIVEPMKEVGNDMCVLSTSDFEFKNEDQISVTLDKKNAYLVIKLDETLDSSLVYVPDKNFKYVISLFNDASAFPITRFKGKTHNIWVRYATKEEIIQYRNLAINTHDQKDFVGYYPHAVANVETRNESTFFACNAIDGCYANNGHGYYPYQSWGINQQKDAKLTINFGTKVEIDKISVTLRNDFPHDSYWTQATLMFSDNTTETIVLEKTKDRQFFTFSRGIVTETVTLCNLIKVEDSSPFPALTQIECYGCYL